MYSLSILIPELPKSLNKKLRSHFFSNNAESKHWDKLIHSLTIKKRPKIPLTHARIYITRHYYRTLDFDGLVGSLKPVIDSLITCKIIKNDSWDVVGAWHVDQVFRPKKDGPILEIIVEEVIIQDANEHDEIVSVHREYPTSFFVPDLLHIGKDN